MSIEGRGAQGRKGVIREGKGRVEKVNGRVRRMGVSREGNGGGGGGGGEEKEKTG